MARIINHENVSLQDKFSAIKPLIKWSYFKRKKAFKTTQLQRLSPSNKRKLTLIFNEVKKETGLNYKVFKFESKAKTTAAIKKFNPSIAGKKWLKNPILPESNNENTSIRFQKVTRYKTVKKRIRIKPKKG